VPSCPVDMLVEPKMNQFAVALFAATVVSLPSGALAQAQFPAHGTVMSAAPVFLFPDANRVPLATLRDGCLLRIVGAEGEWYRVEFEQDSLGRRTGFVSRTAVRVDGVVADPLTRRAMPNAPVTGGIVAVPAEAQSTSTVVPVNALVSPPAVAAAPKLRPALAAVNAQAYDGPPVDTMIRSLGLIPEDVERVIASGLARRGQSTGLRLVDSGQQWMAALSASGSGATASNGFSVHIYTPLAWVEQMASDAAKEYRTFGMANLTADVFEPVVRVSVYPDTPNTVSARGMAGTSSVRHVVLRDEHKRIVIQPSSKETFTEEAANAMGGRATFEGVRATFPLDALGELRGESDDGEFYVTVVGTTGEERDFKVKRKHFERLR
jgi:hypothetical protein